ncbi:hypothetical protein GQX74_001297 [Glossina fuscipes]|nr:hypothetical protein GQX74_001297 [Glossina fuscipes]
MSQYFFQQNLLKSDSSPDTSNSSGSSSSKSEEDRQVRSKRCQLRNANFTSSQRHEWMAVNRSGRVRVVIEIPSVGTKSTQRAAAKNNNLEIVCNVLAAATQVVSEFFSSPVFSSNELVVPSRKATSASHVPSTTTPEMIKEYVQRGMPEVDFDISVDEQIWSKSILIGYCSTRPWEMLKKLNTEVLIVYQNIRGFNAKRRNILSLLLAQTENYIEYSCSGKGMEKPKARSI